MGWGAWGTVVDSAVLLWGQKAEHLVGWRQVHRKRGGWAGSQEPWKDRELRRDPGLSPASGGGLGMTKQLLNMWRLSRCCQTLKLCKFARAAGVPRTPSLPT